MNSFVDGPSAVVADNQQYWLELHRPQQQQQQPANGNDDSLHLPARIINRNQLQLLGVIGEGAFGRVLKGLLSLAFSRVYYWPRNFVQCGICYQNVCTSVRQSHS